MSALQPWCGHLGVGLIGQERPPLSDGIRRVHEDHGPVHFVHRLRRSHRLRVVPRVRGRRLGAGPGRHTSGKKSQRSCLLLHFRPWRKVPDGSSRLPAGSAWTGRISAPQIVSFGIVPASCTPTNPSSRCWRRGASRLRAAWPTPRVLGGSWPGLKCRAWRGGEGRGRGKAVDRGGSRRRCQSRGGGNAQGHCRGRTDCRPSDAADWDSARMLAESSARLAGSLSRRQRQSPARS